MRTQALPVVIAFAVLCQVLPAAAAEPAVSVVRHGQSVVVSRGERVAAKLLALAESCSVNSTAYAVAADSWATAMASGSFVQLSFQSPVTLLLAGTNGQAREARQVQSLLLPLPIGHWPEHLFVQSGGNTISLTKFNPGALKDLVLEPELLLGSELPYRSLIGPRGER